MKKAKILFIISALFTCFTIQSLYAANHAVSISGGYAFSFIKGGQDILYKYNPSLPLLTVKNRPINAYSNRVNNFSLEYQSIFNKFIIGANFNLTNPIYESSLKEDEYTKNGPIKIITNNVDISVIALYNIANIKQFSLYGGGSLGIGFMHIAQNSTYFVITNSKHNNQIYFVPRFILDGEFNISKHIAIFSRLSFMPKLLGPDVTYQVNPTYTKPNDNMVENTVTVDSISTLDASIGIRFKF